MVTQESNDPRGNNFPPDEAYAAEAQKAPYVSPFDADSFGGSFSDGGVPSSAEDSHSDEAFQLREAERAREREDLFSRLNERQAEAVNFPKKSVLILAGAGSGKTSVLTARIAHLVSTGQHSARGILAVTFTNKAAQEMQNRLRKLLDKRSVMDMWVGTFHSLSNKMLRENFEAAGLPKNFAILDTDGQESVCRGVLKDFGLTKGAVKEAAKARKAAAQTDLLSMADPLAAAGGLAADDIEDEGGKSEFVTPGQCAKYISARKEAMMKPEPPISVSTMSTDLEQMEAVYAEYESRLSNAGLLDFQDLLTKGVDLLKSNTDVRDKYRSRFQAILVDETQDTNDIQFEWIQLLKSAHAHVMAVGDDSQSIYSFRGANPANMTRFVKEMTADAEAPKGRIIKLEQNYRSLPHILDAANAIIDRNPDQIKKTLFTSQRDRGERIDLVNFGNGMFEASAIADSIHKMVKDHAIVPSEIAVLYRTNMQSRLIEQEMNKRGLPVTVYGGYRFYDRQEIKNVLSYLDLVCDLSRDLSFVRVVNFPPRGIGERTVEELRQDAQLRRLPMMEVIGERSELLSQNPDALGNAAAQKKQRQLEKFAALFLDLAESACTQPLSELIETIMERAGIRQHYIDEASGSKASQEEVDERLANVGELVSAAKQFENDNPTLLTAAEQLPEYLAYVALMTSTSEADMTKKATVSLMTVHSSKGLEFDHVFLVGLEEATFPHSRAIKEDGESSDGKSIDQSLRELGATQDDDGNDLVFDDVDDGESLRVDGDGIKEERRLMYVAVTRARKTLTITHAKERLLNGQITQCTPSRFISEIPSDRLNYIDDSKSRLNFKRSGSRGNGNHEYGGDAFDTGRSERRDTTPAAKPAAQRAALTQASFDTADMSTDPSIVGAGAILVVSKRKGGVVELPGDTVIDVDRSHPVLGNRHYLTDHEDPVERAAVIAAYADDYATDFAAKGPMFQATEDLAKRVVGGERIALRCWCAPRNCHADIIAGKVLDMTRVMTATNTGAAAGSDKNHHMTPQLLARINGITGGTSGTAVTTSVSASPVPLKPWQRRGSIAFAPVAPAAAVVAAAEVAAATLAVPSDASSGAARTVAVIGTAGRDKNQPMTAQLWDSMIADAKLHVRPADTLVSGGAAWADHIAVRLFLDGTVKHLVLHLPAPLIMGQFSGPDKSAASAANFYHDKFTRVTGVNARAEIGEALLKGATITEQPESSGYAAMFARNALVAKGAESVLAYTFGPDAVPADGGTKDTWDQVGGDRVHVSLLTIGNANNAKEALSSFAFPARLNLPADEKQLSASTDCSATPPSAAMARLNLLGKRRPSARP